MKDVLKSCGRYFWPTGENVLSTVGTTSQKGPVNIIQLFFSSSCSLRSYVVALSLSLSLSGKQRWFLERDCLEIGEALLSNYANVNLKLEM